MDKDTTAERSGVFFHKLKGGHPAGAAYHLTPEEMEANRSGGPESTPFEPVADILAWAVTASTRGEDCGLLVECGNARYARLVLVVLYPVIKALGQMGVNRDRMIRWAIDDQIEMNTRDAALYLTTAGWEEASDAA